MLWRQPLCVYHERVWYNCGLVSAYHPVSAVSPASDQPPQPSFIALHLWLADTPWRLSGGWLLFAGLIAAAGWQTLYTALVSTLLALVLAEVLWGALWSQLVPIHAWPLHHARRRPRLPYVQPGSPAARLLGWPVPGPAAAIARAGLPLLAMAVLLAILVGRTAVLASIGVLLVVLLAMAAQRARLVSLVGWLQALVQVAAPYMLGVALAGPWPNGASGARLVLLGFGYTLLARALIFVALARDPGSVKTDLSVSFHRLLLAAAGTTLVTAVLLFGQQYLAAGLVVLLAAAPLLILGAGNDLVQTQRTAQPWLLALVLVSAAAVGTGIG